MRILSMARSDAPIDEGLMAPVGAGRAQLDSMGGEAALATNMLRARPRITSERRRRNSIIYRERARSDRPSRTVVRRPRERGRKPREMIEVRLRPGVILGRALRLDWHWIHQSFPQGIASEIVRFAQAIWVQIPCNNP